MIDPFGLEASLGERIGRRVNWHVKVGFGIGKKPPLLPSPPDKYSTTYEQYLLGGVSGLIESGGENYPLVGWITGVTPAGMVLWTPPYLFINIFTEHDVPFYPPFSPPKSDKACQ